MDQVFDFVRNLLACDVCSTELVDNENSEKVKGSKDRMQRFNAQMKWIRDGLRNIEGVVMPAYGSQQPPADVAPDLFSQI